MAFLLQLAGELVLDAEAGVGGGSIVKGAETLATTFKNEVIKGIPWGLGEGAGFIAGSKVIENVKKDMGFDKPDDKQPVNINRKRKHTRKVG